LSSDEQIRSIDDFVQKLKATNEYKESLSLLIPMIQSIKTSEYSREILKPCATKIIARSALQQKRALLLRESLKAIPRNETETLQKALYYLGFFEIAVTNIIDQLIMIFIANHHDFYVYFNRDYAKKFEDLDNASLAEKLAFLRHHEFNLPIVNKKLRNSIAHMDFDPLPNGKIKVDNQEYDLTREILLISYFVILFGTALDEAHFPETIKEFIKYSKT
jgi:hypothetical protein